MHVCSTVSISKIKNKYYTWIITLLFDVDAIFYKSFGFLRVEFLWILRSVVKAAMLAMIYIHNERDASHCDVIIVYIIWSANFTFSKNENCYQLKMSCIIKIEINHKLYKEYHQICQQSHLKTFSIERHYP